MSAKNSFVCFYVVQILMILQEIPFRNEYQNNVAVLNYNLKKFTNELQND